MQKSDGNSYLSLFKDRVLESLFLPQLYIGTLSYVAHNNIVLKQSYNSPFTKFNLIK